MDRRILPGQKGMKGRSRKAGQALKFHNFVANEKKSLNFGHEHTLTHCLREEHGTKQITVSHWTSNPISPKEETTPSTSFVTPKSSPVVVSSFPPSSSSSSSSSRPPLVKPQTGLKGIKNPREPSDGNRQQRSQKQSILECLLARNLSAVQSSGSPGSSRKETKTAFTGKVNKRKPLIIRRVITTTERTKGMSGIEGNGPHQLHLLPPRPPPDSLCPIIHAQPHSHAQANGVTQDQPLDLTVKKTSMQVSDRKSLITSVEKSAAQAASIMASVRGKHLSGLPPCKSFSDYDIMMSPTFHQQQQNYANSPDLPGDEQRQFKGAANQRTIIKQKLEDAFRENGFLVKTKQVSDGDATFCKFRQLRKYTRYYLKSWHKHLPDEVNKLYKGFLPPKTTTHRGLASWQIEHPKE